MSKAFYKMQKTDISFGTKAMFKAHSCSSWDSSRAHMPTRLTDLELADSIEERLITYTSLSRTKQNNNPGDSKTIPRSLR